MQSLSWLCNSRHNFVCRIEKFFRNGRAAMTQGRDDPVRIVPNVRLSDVRRGDLCL